MSEILVILLFHVIISPFYRKVKEEPQEESHPTLKVELQTIRLNPDSQKLVLDTLRFIHGPQFKLGSASLYKVRTEY